MSSGLAIAPPRGATLRTRRATNKPVSSRRQSVPPTRSTRILRKLGTKTANAAGQGRVMRGEGRELMLDLTRRLVTPSLRSDVPAFIVMDVVAGRRGSRRRGGGSSTWRSASRPRRRRRAARAAAQAALGGPVGYTESLGIAPLRRAHRRPLPRALRHRPRSRPRHGDDRLVGGLHARLSRHVRAGRPGRHRLSGLSALSQHPRGARLRAGGDRDVGEQPLGAHGRRRDRRASRAPARRRAVRKPRQSDRHHDDSAMRSPRSLPRRKARASAASPTRSITASTTPFRRRPRSPIPAMR